MRKPQGMTINYSMIMDENGQHEMGFHYNDTDGVDIDRHYQGKDVDKMLSKLCQEVITEVATQTAEIEKQKKLAEAKKATKVKKAAPKVDKTEQSKRIAELEARLKDLEDKNQSLQIDNEILNRRIKDTLKAESLENEKIKKENSIENDILNHSYSLVDEFIKALGW